ncbi:MAG: hypothetical protein RLN90_04585 [Balneolaceae bacterium]
MKKLNHLLVLILVAGVTFYSCEGVEDSLVDDRLEDNPAPTAPPAPSGSQGNADYTKFVSIGNSLTAGFMDAALYNQGQQSSLGALIAAQLKIAVESDGGTFDEFNQPDINSVNGFNTSIQPDNDPTTAPAFGRIKLDLVAGVPSPTINGDPIGAYSGTISSLNNFGIPGIQVGQMLTAGAGTPGDPAFSPFYARMASSPGTSTILGDVIATQPTFFTLWIGNNDILGYAATGGSNEAIFTSEGDFNTRFNAVVDALMANTSAKGVIANIPPVTTAPFFRAVTWNNVALDQATADQINSGFAAVNGAIQGCANVGVAQSDIDRRLVSYNAGNNPILAIDEELDDLGTCFDLLLGAQQISAQQRAQLTPYEQSRPLVEGELVLLSAGSVLGTEADGDASTADTPIGVVIPLGFSLAEGSLSGDKYYLSLAEQAAIQSRSVAFNTTIATAVLSRTDGRLGLFDTNAGLPGNPNITLGVFADLLGLDGELGIEIEGTLLDPDFLPNGIYSTDGIHPNIRGNAILANEFLKVMEGTFGSTIPKVSVIAKPGITACSGDCVSEQ